MTSVSSHECAMLSDMFPVERPRLTAMEETREQDCFVHFDVRGQLDVPVIYNPRLIVRPIVFCYIMY